MKPLIRKTFLSAAFLCILLSASAQCDIQHRIYPDGTMFFSIEPVNFYWTQTKALKGCIVTDKENFYLGLQPSPFPEKPLGKKLRDDLEIKLSNDSILHIEHFDTRYLHHDSVMQLLYLIDEKFLDDFVKYEILSAKINMKGDEGVRTYVFKLHKSAIREQLDCFMNEPEGLKDKKK